MLIALQGLDGGSEIVHSHAEFQEGLQFVFMYVGRFLHFDDEGFDDAVWVPKSHLQLGDDVWNIVWLNQEWLHGFEGVSLQGLLEADDIVAVAELA